MRGRYKRRDLKEGSDGVAGLSPLAAEISASSTESDAPVPGGTVRGVGGSKKGLRCATYGGEKVYLGVRVKMPVRDLLKNIRLSKGWEHHDLKQRCRKTGKGEIKRVKTRSRRQAVKVQHPTKSLEELAIIVEVLEEDLRTGNTSHSLPQNRIFSEPPVSPELSSTGAGHGSDEYDEMISSPESYMSYSPGTSEYLQARSPQGFAFNGNGYVGEDGEGGKDQLEPWNADGSAFFWTQLQREESQLSEISDAVLLAPDERGKTALHKVACVGKRALGYAIGKRMAALNSMDLKDSEGMTALLYAAKHNHHLMVADLIRLGANVNETNSLGKSCLHLSAESGYIRVLEVLERVMMEGVYVDVEATDNCGMSVLQCASLALKSTVRQLECSRSPGPTRLHTLRREQMMDTLECLLQMGSYFHTMTSRSMLPRLS